MLSTALLRSLRFQARPKRATFLALEARGGSPMPYETIEKPPVDRLPVRPNLYDYEKQRASFKWEELARELDGLPGGGLNIAYEALDRHVAKGRGERAGIIWEGKNGEQETYSYAELARLANKWANVLRNLG